MTSRNTSVTRGSLPQRVAIAVWARSAGRCAMCNRFLVDTRSFFHTVLTGQLAHNVGATDGAASPRSGVEDVTNREAEENLLLLCYDCHRLVDNPEHEDMFTTEYLRAMKRDHEARIQRVTDHGGLTRTAVVRVGGNIRGSHAMASRRDVGAVLIDEGFLPLVESQWTGDFTCDIPGDETDRAYWLAAQDAVDKATNLVSQAVANGDVEHVSVFAIAPIPVLVYLGARLDDKVPARIYQRVRDSENAWRWNLSSEPVSFDFAADTPGSAESEDVVLCVSVSAPIDSARIPVNLTSAPRYSIGPDQVDPSPTLVSHPESVAAFATTWRELLAHVERTHPGKRWHVVAAVPVSIAVELGRAFMREAQPPVTVYQRGNDQYFEALQVNT